MKQALFIYFTPDKKNFQIIRPSDVFTGGWAALAEGITNSNLKEGIKRYDHFEVK